MSARHEDLPTAIGLVNPAKSELLGAVYTLLGTFPFRWFELQAKKRGSLEAV